MRSSAETGRRGENNAAKYLERKGYCILAKNHREKWGELDIIARSPDRTLVFVEVKTMNSSNDSGLKPEDHITRTKLDKLSKLSSFYANKSWRLVDKKKGWRIDLIAITNDRDNSVISHYENIGEF